MAKKMLIVHGYSDGSTSFTKLGEFFVAHAGYAEKDIYYADYSSMDDEATFRDFGDKLEEDYQREFNGERIDVACHSTGSLVIRAWLAIRYLRRKERGLDLNCPVHRLLMFAPANFGSDLAAMGQSFLGKFRTTFFNSHSHKGEDFLESGKVVLQGLEPASPFQWVLSKHDLGSRNSYFAVKASADQRCFPFVFAAGDAYGGIQAKLIKKRKMLGTDGTVRISGTNINTRHCRLSMRDSGCVFRWEDEHKHPQIPFAVFAGFNHGSIVDPKRRMAAYLDQNGPGRLALEALSVTSAAKYRAAVDRFKQADEANFEKLKGKRKSRYQQFFFRVRDDVDLKVDDYYVDFYVVGPDDQPQRDLTERFERQFEAKFYRHSADPACRAVMMNLTKIKDFLARLKAAKSRLVFDITAEPPLPNISYERGEFVIYDGAKPGENPNFIHPNTTILIDVVMNRRAASKIMHLKDSNLKPLPEEERLAALEAAAGPPTELTGRARLVRPVREKK